MDINQIAAINLRRSQLAVIGTTTGPGAGTGDSFFDTTLIGVGAGSFVSMLAILYPGQPTKVDSMAITGFDNVTGEVALARAYKGVALAIPAFVPYMIVTFRFAAADVAALTANVGNASASALGSLYAILGNPSVSLTSKINHIPKFTGNLWWVSKAGSDANDGKSPEQAFLTPPHAISEAAAGDRIYVKAGAYDGAINLNKVGLELVCEQGTVFSNITPGTVLVVSANYCRVVGAIVSQAGETGFQITGSFCSFDDCLAFACDVGFDDDGAETHLENCRSILHTATGFDISAGYGLYDRCIAAGGGVAVTGVLLSDAAADHNGFHDCHTLGNTTRGWDVVAGADNNLFTNCSTGAGDGAKSDLGTNNTWDDFSEGSQIVAGQTRDQDLADIFDRLGAPAGLSLAADLAAIALIVADIQEVTGTDLEAKLDALYPYHGLVYYGKVTTYTDTTHFKASGLIGFGDDYFNDHHVYVVRDAAGAGGDPQGEMQPISDYVSSDGTFTHTAFTLPLTADDEVLILHPAIASLINTTYGLSAIKTETALIKTQTDKIAGKMLFSMDFWSDPVEGKAVTDAQVTAAVGAPVVVDLPDGVTVVRAIVMMKFRMVENTNAEENSLDCAAAQPIQVDNSANDGWVDAIDFVDEQFKIAAETREGGDILIGDNNVVARVSGDETYDFQWKLAKAHKANIQFNDIQMGIRIWYSV